MTSSIILRPDWSGKGHRPQHHDLDNISDGDSSNTQAATSLQSGPFQYVDNNLLEQAAQASFLSEVSSMAVDPVTQIVYILRRLDPVVVILNGQGNIIDQWTSAKTGIKAGHSIKLRRSGSDRQLSVWVVDMTASCILIFSPTGQIETRLGPQIGKITLGKVWMQ